MAETTAAPVRAMMRGRLCHRGFGGSAEAGDDRGPCRPRGSAAFARPEGPPRTAAPGPGFELELAVLLRVSPQDGEVGSMVF